MLGTLSLKKGSMFDSNATMLAHGVNCQGVFGAGVAKQISEIYPQAREAYISKHFSLGWKLGEIQDVYCNYCLDRQIKKFMPTSKSVVNMATQDTYGRTGVHVNYEAVAKCFDQLFEIADVNNFKVAIPQIGCGLAGGKWSKVEKLLEAALEKHNVEVEVWVLT